MVEGPGEVYICGECIELCRHILKEELRRGNPNVKEIKPEMEELLDEAIAEIEVRLHEANQKIAEVLHMLSEFRNN